MWKVGRLQVLKVGMVRGTGGRWLVWHGHMTNDDGSWGHTSMGIWWVHWAWRGI